MNKKQYEIYIQYKFQCNLGVLNEMCHLESYTWWLKDQYWDTNLPFFILIQIIPNRQNRHLHTTTYFEEIWQDSRIEESKCLSICHQN